MRSLQRRLRSLLTREASNVELSEELAFHLEQAIADNMARGMSREAARAAARQSFGSIPEATENCYETRGIAPELDGIRAGSSVGLGHIDAYR